LDDSLETQIKKIKALSFLQRKKPGENSMLPPKGKQKTMETGRTNRRKRMKTIKTCHLHKGRVAIRVSGLYQR
jgi:hypothetical protein